MGLVKGALVGALCGTMALSGCSVQSVQRDAPEGPDDCRAYWIEERGGKPREQSDDVSAFEVAVISFLSGFAKRTTSPSAANARYRNCLAQFGVADSDAFENASRLPNVPSPLLPRQPPKKPAGCPRGSSVLYGGAGYCVGR